MNYRDRISNYVKDISANSCQKKEVVVLAVDDGGNVHYLPKSQFRGKRTNSYSKIRSTVMKRR